MRLRYLIILLLLFGLACNSEREEKSSAGETAIDSTFSKSKWHVKEGRDYPYRPQMVDDILYNDSLRGLDKVELLDMLGDPDRSNKGYLYYKVSEKRLGAWTLNARTLVVKLDADSLVEWIKLHE